MYIGFEIDGEQLPRLSITDHEYYRNIALDNYDQYKKTIQKKIKKGFDLSYNNEIEVKPIESTWFPSVKSHVFLSHSHVDENLALVLAGVLKDTCNVDVFIDSCIWNYSDDLLRILDKHYCRMDSGYYNYECRNITTAQVHLILNMALAKMIHNTECFMFLKTDNSVRMKNSISSEETESPWICDELLMASIITRRSKEIHRKEYRLSHSFSINESLQCFPRFIYDISFMDMKCLTYTQLLNIAHLSSEEYYGDNKVSQAERFLDLLYKEMKINEMEALNG